MPDNDDRSEATDCRRLGSRKLARPAKSKRGTALDGNLQPRRGRFARTVPVGERGSDRAVEADTGPHIVLAGGGPYADHCSASRDNGCGGSHRCESAMVWLAVHDCWELQIPWFPIREHIWFSTGAVCS